MILHRSSPAHFVSYTYVTLMFQSPPPPPPPPPQQQQQPLTQQAPVSTPTTNDGIFWSPAPAHSVQPTSILQRPSQPP